MSRSKAVSIIMPVYNSPRSYLRESVSSLAEQNGIDLGDVELVMVDDFSSPSYMKDIEEVINDIGKRYPKMNIVLGSNRYEKGIGNSRTTAFEMSSGEYVGVLDHDDYLMPNAIRKSWEAMESSTHASMIFSDHTKYNDTLTEPLFHRDKSMWFELHKLYKNTALDPLLHTMFTGHFQFFRGQAMKEVNSYRNFHNFGGEDHNLVLRISHLTPEVNIVHLPETLYLHRQHPGAVTQKKEMVIENDKKMLLLTLRKLGYDISGVEFFDWVEERYSYYDISIDGKRVDVPWLDRETLSIIPPQE